jgi:hypothetical protein
LRIVIKDSDVSRGHVGNVHMVLVLDQTNQRATHADDIVVGMGAKAQSRFRLEPGWMRFDGIHHPIEYPMRDFLGTPWFPKQLVQIVVAKVFVGKLEQGLAGFLTKPKRGPLGERIGPMDMVQ